MNTTRCSILIVDDTPANLRLLSGILAQKDYMIRPVTDGALALSAARTDPPDLILLDIMMPTMSGYDVCKQLKADERTRDISVIFISAKQEILDKVTAFSLGAVDYITKPFQAEEVLARVETHLSLRNLRKSLEEKNQQLSETLQRLKATQEQLIVREKMAALGHLIAGIAHEINTPLGAIQASIGNISNALQASLQQLPKLFQQLSAEQQTTFFALLQKALDTPGSLSSREARQVKRKLTEELTAYAIPDADAIAATLVNMGIYEEIAPFLGLLHDDNRLFIVQTAYHLVMQHNNSHNIMSAVERASKVVFALKKYAHYDESDQKIKADIVEGLEAVLTLYHNHLKKGITVNKVYADIPQILCYPDELQQVWINVIHNAIRAMEGHGILEITTEIAEINHRTAVVVAITDSGHGIPAAIQPRIFEPFFTTKPAGEGSGLGLDIVHQIIERHQGKIDVESHPGRTTFRIFLPIESESGERG
ncbi:MAG: response regulator [Candidatus Vecturithrix sp.]|jgi:signal transduction histidine kinase|nr:response regulator [Candidatus Vecturithrix sp.]